MARQKPDEASLKAHQGLTINTSLPGRNFTKMPTDPYEKGVPDQSDEDRLKGLEVALPDALSGKQLKVISGGASTSATSTGPAREIATITDSDIPAGASPELREFLKADEANLIKTFKTFSDQTFKPLMTQEPSEICEALIAMNLLQPFMANRVIYKDTTWQGYEFIYRQEKVNIITLFNDYLRLKIGTRELTEDKSKITKIAMHLLTTSASDLEKQEILSLLKQYSEYGDTEVHNFIINNDLLNVPFVNAEIETDYSSQQPKKRIASKRYTGFDIIGEWELSTIMDNSPSHQTKTMLKRFFKTPTGISVLARIAIREPIQEAIIKQGVDFNSFRWGTTELVNDITATGQLILPVIFKIPKQTLPKMFSILRDYTDRGNIPALITAMNSEDNQIQIEGRAPGLTALVNKYLAATLPSVFE
ncbi:MAG: hypothetical protein NWS47_01610 [Alphaproteobacteria bacterium]|nr:hypothetical protein [Alphaproteobacteria bacterium]